MTLPPEQTNATAWFGPEMAARADWRMHLTPTDRAEIETATAALVAGNTDIAGITARDFPLPTLAPRLKARFRDEVLNGRGFLLIRGLSVERWKTAQSGGLSALVSSATIFNEMRRRRPDLLQLLFEPIATDRRGEIPEGAKPWFEIPVFTWHAGYLNAIYQRQYINSAQRFPEAPRLTPAHVEALDLFDSLADDPKLNMTMEFQPGDVQLVHNHTLLHDRTGFIDWPEPERRRHLLRLWLAANDARPLPDVFAQRYGSTTIGDRGGVIVKSTKLQAPLQAA
jgi:hypothetical protein